MSRPWFPFYPADFLKDTMHLTAAEVGAYMLLIMHYWQHRGLPADEARYPTIAKLSPEQWSGSRDAIAALFAKGWVHPRVDHELEQADEKYRRRAEAGRAGGNAKAARQQSRSNATGNALAESYQPQPQSISNEIDTPLPKPKASRGTRLAPDWWPNEAEVLYALDRGVPVAVVKTEAEKFRNFWVAKTGKDATKADWTATWQNWIIRTCEQRGFAPVDPSTDIDRRATGFVLDNDPRWVALTDRWKREKGRSPPKTDGRSEHGTGQGWHFPAEWIDELKATEQAG